MLITKEVETYLSSNINWYETRGYKIPRRIDDYGKNSIKLGAKLKVKVNDLPNGSDVLVDVICDGCTKILIGMTWYNYKKYVKEDGTYYCQKCARNGYKKWISFYEWCYLNLSKDEANEILDRWDYSLNKLTPKEVSFGSHGDNKMGYWFKCLKHPEHISEQKLICNFVKGYKSSINCYQCDSIAMTHPYLIKYFVDKEETLKYSYGSSLKKFLLKCPNCGFEKELNIMSLINNGLGCPRCSDGKSYPEKFLFSFFEQIDSTDFISQLSKKTFNWCCSFKYDFYLNNFDIIVETHGDQHYREIRNNWGTLEETQNNDFDKEWLARSNNIKNYIILDCRKSELEWIKDNIMLSRLPKLLNFKESDIDWLKCHEFACKNLVKMTCDEFNKSKNVTEIMKYLKIGRNTVIRYLNQGAKVGWCNYNGKDEKIKNNILTHNRFSIKVICLTTGEVFNSQKEACENYNIKGVSGIGSCCKNNKEYCGKHPATNEPLKWMYYDEYIKSNPHSTPNSNVITYI